MKRVVLSASHPHGERAQSVRPYSHEDIDLAASALVEAVLERDDVILRFGSHPSITPLVLAIADSLPSIQGSRIELVFSRYFSREYTVEMRRLAALEGVVEIPTRRAVSASASQARDKSLSLMRRDLMAPPIDAVFFVGGMSGLDEEMRVVRTIHPAAQLFSFTAPGGRAATLVSESSETTQGPIQEIDGVSYLLASREALASVTS